MNILKSIFAKWVRGMAKGEVIFEDYTIKVQNAIDDKINAVLEECAGELESQVKRNTSVGRVAGSKTKNEWKHKVVDSEHTAYIGNSEETAIWLEFGTGEYALEGKGRKGGWYIPIGSGKGCISQAVVDAYGFKVIEGKNGKKFAHTYGMKAQRPFFKAYNSMKNKIINYIQNAFKGM